MNEGERAGAKKKPSILRAFAQPSAWTMLFFGFSSGLPFLLVAGTLAYWLKERGIALRDITMIASAGMCYALKFLWAPLLDHWRLPGFAKLGRRRGWLLFAQIGVIVALLAMSALTPADLSAFVIATLAVAFFGATQDIAVDAYRIEIAPPESQGALVATYSLGYRFGLLLAGALAPIMADHVDWRYVYVVMAASMIVPIAANLLAPEPDAAEVPSSRWREVMRDGVVAPFADFFRRYRWPLALATLLFILLFKIPEQATIGGIMSPFYRDMGFSQTEIGAISKIWGVWIGMAGVFIGGAGVARFGIGPTLGFAIVLCGASNLSYLWLIAHPGDLAALAAVIAATDLTLGFLGPPTVAFLSSLVNRKHTATQYALLASLVNLPGKVLGFFAGGLVVASGYANFFLLTMTTIVPAVLLFMWVQPRLSAANAADPDSTARHP
jgi:PAT family beta-lactamase induction signal transducer AmpG